MLLGSLFFFPPFFQPGSDTMHMHVQMICAWSGYIRSYILIVTQVIRVVCEPKLIIIDIVTHEAVYTKFLSRTAVIIKFGYKTVSNAIKTHRILV